MRKWWSERKCRNVIPQETKIHFLPCPSRCTASSCHMTLLFLFLINTPAIHKLHTTLSYTFKHNKSQHVCADTRNHECGHKRSSTDLHVNTPKPTNLLPTHVYTLTVILTVTQSRSRGSWMCWDLPWLRWDTATAWMCFPNWHCPILTLNTCKHISKTHRKRQIRTCFCS